MYFNAILIPVHVSIIQSSSSDDNLTSRYVTIYR